MDGQQYTRVLGDSYIGSVGGELYFRANPSVIYDGGRYRMWYSAGSEWIDIAGKAMPVCYLRYAESSDGIHGLFGGEVVLRIGAADEHGLARPWVMRNGESWELFYSVRRTSLRACRMAYAVSEDGKIWRRRDCDFGLEPSDDGWDYQAVCYGTPPRIGGRTWLFYNGNNFVETGYGAALREG
jgi:hypothetical protein